MERRAFVLLSSLMLAVVMVMFVAAAVELGPGGLRFGRSGQERVSSEQAARSGLDYCLAQLRLDPNWRGDKNSTTVSRPDFVVSESFGNVVGLIRAEDGNWVQFRVRFNFQDGPGGADNFAADPAFAVDHPYVSFNNLLATLPAGVPRADGSGYRVTSSSQTAFQLPGGCASLAVEGRSGLRGAEPATPWVLFAATGPRVVVEAVFQRNTQAVTQTFQPSGSMAGKDFRVELDKNVGTVSVTAAQPTDTPRLRAKSAAAVTGGAAQNYLSPQGEVRTKAGVLGAAYDASQTSVVPEPLIDPYFQLAWNQVKKASSSGPVLKGGTYVWWDDGSLHYYDMSYSDYVNYMQDPANVNDPGTTPVLPTTVQFVDQDGLKMMIVSGDVYVEGSDLGVTEMAVIPRNGAADAPPGDPEEGGGAAGVKAFAIDASTNPTLIVNFLQQSGQPGSGGFELRDASGAEYGDLEWSGGPSFSLSWQNGESPQQKETILRYWLNPNLPEFAGWSVVGSDPHNLSFDTPTVLTALSYSGTGQPNGVINPPGVTDTLTASDLQLEFAPPPGGSAVISSEGDLTLTGSIVGSGGSITSGGNIHVTGLGASFVGEANPVNMYAVGDIYFSTLDETTGGAYDYRDVNLKGIVYTQGNFVARLGSSVLPGGWGSLNIDGMLIAYGGDPANSSLPPGSNGKGDVNVRAGSVSLVQNTVYTPGVGALPPGALSLQRIAWSNRF